MYFCCDVLNSLNPGESIKTKTLSRQITASLFFLKEFSGNAGRKQNGEINYKMATTFGMYI